MFSYGSFFQGMGVSSFCWWLFLQGRSFLQPFVFGNYDYCDDTTNEVEDSWSLRQWGAFVAWTCLWQQYFWNKRVSQQRRPLRDYGNWAIIDLGDVVEDNDATTTKSDDTIIRRNQVYQHFTELFVQNGIHVILILKETPHEQEVAWIQKITWQHKNAKIHTFTRHELYNNGNDNNNHNNGNKTPNNEMSRNCSTIGIDLLLGQFMTVGFLVTTTTTSAAANNKINDSATVQEWPDQHSSSMMRSVQRWFEFRSTGAFILLPGCHDTTTLQSSTRQDDFLVCKEQRQKLKKYGIDVLRISKDATETTAVTNATLVHVALQQLGKTDVLSIRHFVVHWLWQFLRR
mmetsp:Transcript_17924/g.27711  ORF Transcript_17924/g.27711 Transcript_17924/m.27711 type:complete len:344 (+) Transcript_17924:408-1439(+)